MSNQGFDASVYEAVGGRSFFVELVDGFYARVSADRLLRPMYPDDLTDSRRHLAGFLTQYWGGPSTYSDERGHPRLRMRHAPFATGIAERDAWLRHMLGALDAVAAARGTPVEADRRVPPTSGSPRCGRRRRGGSGSSVGDVPNCPLPIC